MNRVECLDHSYFEYHGSFYSQTEGGPMGSPLTVALAEVRVSEIESLALSSSADPPSVYKHFVDDGISQYRDRQHADIFLQHLNSQSNDLVYTAEHPRSNGSLPFLNGNQYFHPSAKRSNPLALAHDPSISMPESPYPAPSLTFPLPYPFS